MYFLYKATDSSDEEKYIVVPSNPVTYYEDGECHSRFFGFMLKGDCLSFEELDVRVSNWDELYGKRFFISNVVDTVESAIQSIKLMEELRQERTNPGSGYHSRLTEKSHK